MLMPNRGSQAAGYRYGYQGSEKDDEVKGAGNSYFTENRILDPRIGRWLSIDPVTQHWQSPYISMNNNPIFINDVLGNVGDVTNLAKKDRDNLKADLEAKSGLTIKEETDEITGFVTWTIDKSAGVTKDINGKKIGSKLARKDLNAILGEDTYISIQSSNDDPRIDDGKYYKGVITLDFTDIENNMKNTSANINKTSFGYALTFFHELYHAPEFGSLMDPTDQLFRFAKAQNDFRVNRIRKELGPDYGIRQHYTAFLLPSSQSDYDKFIPVKAYIALDKQSLKDLKNGLAPTGQFIYYNVTKPKEEKKEN